MKPKTLAMASIFSSLCIVVSYGRGLAIPMIPGVEFMSVIIFATGFMFGLVTGMLSGAIALTVYMLVPYPFAHPAAWLFTISPLLLVIMAALGGMFGLAGGILRRRYSSLNINARFIMMMAIVGFVLTFLYDVLSSIGFYIAYPGVYASVWEAIYLTFIPLWLPYPPIIHTVTNTFVFAIVGPPIIKAIAALPISSARKDSS